MSSDMEALRQYVEAPKNTFYAQDTVAITVSHNLLERKVIELRVDLHMTVGDLKYKLHKQCGSLTSFMHLVLRAGGMDIGVMDDESKKLGFYGLQTGHEIHIIDNDPHSLALGGGLEDVSLVEKFELTEEQYDQRENTLRAYKKKMLKEDPNFVFFPKKKDENAPPPGEESVAGMKVGDRCECHPGDRRGTVMYVGEVEGIAPGHWVGVKFDEPLGKNDGSVKGVKYFECPPSYGGFVRGENCVVGDYPEKDMFAELGSDDEM
eukprot:GFYU01001116.1.p1 GENE.GFYU01001116.1~~GFYU01001116.1.p1  ORF type:complete len:299 (+),score=94.15 GFYU01001116.1:109-897(+)